MGGARFSQNGHLQRKVWLLNIPESFAFNVLPSQQATSTPVFPGCPPRTSDRSDPDSYGDLALPWNSVHVKVCVRLLRMGVSISPSPMELLRTSPTGLQCQMLQGLFLLVPDPHVGVWCGDQNSHSYRWVSVNQLVSSLWSFPPRRYGVVYITKSPLLPLDVASSLSSGVGYLFLRFPVHLGEDYSVFSCEFCCF